jgi:hypothetical protein
LDQLGFLDNLTAEVIVQDETSWTVPHMGVWSVNGFKWRETRTAPIIFESRKQKSVGKEKTWPKHSTFLDFFAASLRDLDVFCIQFTPL